MPVLLRVVQLRVWLGSCLVCGARRVASAPPPWLGAPLRLSRPRTLEELTLDVDNEYAAWRRAAGLEVATEMAAKPGLVLPYVAGAS